MARTASEHRILVLGAGYTGLMCAIGVARRTRRHGGRVTLVNPSRRFTERLRMHQIATGQAVAEHQIPDLITGTGIEFVQGRASGIDLRRHQVHMETAEGGRQLGYDTLVYAIGSVADATSVPGVDAHAYTLDDPRAALRLAARLAEIPAGTVTVCGGGLTGIEAATEIAESHPGVHVILLSRDAPGSMMGEKARDYLNRTLRRLGVEVRAGVEITKVLPGAVELAGGELVHADACLWTTGFTTPPLSKESGLAVDARGRIVVDATLRAVTDSSVYAIGDAAAIQQAWGEIHGTCQSGVPSGVHAAETIARRLKGKKGKPFRFGYIHQPVSLGRRDAVIQFTHADDSPRRWYLTGRVATFYKELVTGSPTPVYRLARHVNIPAAAMSGPGSRAKRTR
jgi:NADH dehydrogenase